MKKSNVVFLLLFALVQWTYGQTNTVEDISEGLLRDIEEKIANLRDLTCDWDGNDGTVKTSGTPAYTDENRHTQQVSDAQFKISLDPGDNGNEAKISLIHMFGGTQAEFDTYITQQVNRLSSPPSGVGLEDLVKKVNDALSNPGGFLAEDEKISDEIWSVRSCTFSRGQPRCKFSAKYYDNGNTSCNRANMKDKIYNFCNGRWGLFKVAIQIRRRRNNYNTCAANNIRESFRCFYIVVLPDIPAGIFTTSPVLNTTYRCNVSEDVVISMPKDANATGICIRPANGASILNNTKREFYPGQFTARFKDSRMLSHWIVQYYKEYKYCSTIFYSPEELVEAVVAPEVYAPQPLSLIIPSCTTNCDVRYQNNLDPDDENVDREVLWYENLNDPDDAYFDTGKLEGCIENTTFYWVAFRDKTKNCNEEDISPRSLVSIFILDDFIDFKRVPRTIVREEGRIFDNRYRTPEVGCTDNEMYYTELRDFTFEEAEQAIVKNSPEYETIVTQFGYKIVPQSVTTVWSRVLDGTELKDDGNENIYATLSDGSKVVCAEKLGISANDYSSRAVYKGKVAIKYVILDNGNGQGLATSPECDLTVEVIKEIKLKPDNDQLCEEEMDRVYNSIVAEYQTDCQSFELEKLCSSNENEMEIGLELDQIISTISSLNGLSEEIVGSSLSGISHSWTPDYALRTPESTTTTIEYDELEQFDENSYKLYQLKVEHQALGISTSFNHCAVVYKCSDCSDDLPTTTITEPKL